MTDPALSVKTDKGRFYSHPHKQSLVPSITNIKNIKAIPALQYVSAREAANYAADNLATLSQLSRDEAVQLIKGAPFRADSEMKIAARNGDIVHDWIDRHIKGETVDPNTYTDKWTGETRQAPSTCRNMWRQFQGVVKQYNPQWVMSEFTVWSETHGYAGTGDWCANIGNALVCADTKTGKGAYPDTALQLSAIGNADYILTPDSVGGYTKCALPKFDRYAILHVRPTFAKLIPVMHTDEWFQAFLGLKTVFETVNKYEDDTLMWSPKIEVRANA